MSVEKLKEARQIVEYCLFVLGLISPEIRELEAHNLYLYLKHAERNLRQVRFLLGGDEP